MLSSSSSTSTASKKWDRDRSLSEKYGVQSAGPIESVPKDEIPPSLRTTFKHIRSLGKTQFASYREIVAADVGRHPWREQVRRRSKLLVSLANTCRRGRKNESSWRLALEPVVLARFTTEVTCTTCRGRLWRSEQEVAIHSVNKDDSAAIRKKRQANRTPCTCRSDISKEDIQEPGINSLFDDRADEAIEYGSLEKALGKRKNKPDRIYGLLKTKRLQRILQRHDKRASHHGKPLSDSIQTTPFPPAENALLFPFLVVEAKSEKSRSSFSDIELQTSFAIREMLIIQDDLCQAASDERGWDGGPLVWFISYAGEQWRISAAYVRTVDGKRVYSIATLWHGVVDTKDGAIQLLLIVDYICDWARDIYREVIIQSLRSLVVNDTRTLTYDPDVLSAFDWQNRWHDRQATIRDASEAPDFERNSFESLGDDICSVRDVSHIRSVLIGIYVSEDNFDYLMESTDSDEEAQKLAAEVLISLKDASLVTGNALDALEIMWTGKDRGGSDSSSPDKKFWVVTGLAAYLAPDWEQSRAIFYLAVEESLVESILRIAGADRDQLLAFCGNSFVEDKLFKDYYSRYKRHVARDNLLACLARSYIDPQTVARSAPDLFTADDKSQYYLSSLALLSQHVSGLEEDGLCPEGSVGQMVHQIYKRHCIGRSRPCSPLFRMSDLLELVPLVDHLPEATEVLSAAVWPLDNTISTPPGSDVLLAAAPDPDSNEGFPQVCVFVMNPSQKSHQAQAMKICQASLDAQFCAKRFDIQRKWSRLWNLRGAALHEVQSRAAEVFQSDLARRFNPVADGGLTLSKADSGSEALLVLEGTTAADGFPGTTSSTDSEASSRSYRNGISDSRSSSVEIIEVRPRVVVLGTPGPVGSEGHVPPRRRTRSMAKTPKAIHSILKKGTTVRESRLSVSLPGSSGETSRESNKTTPSPSRPDKHSKQTTRKRAPQVEVTTEAGPSNTTLTADLRATKRRKCASGAVSRGR